MELTLKIAVLAGGYSPERDVAFLSGSLIANSLCRSGHEVALLDVFFPYTGVKDESAFTTDGNFMYTIPKTPPDLAALRASVPGNALIGDGVLDICRLADVVFLALHGGMGEDGRLQAILSSMGIPYTGSDFSSCLAAMDKSFSKLLFRAAGVATADFTVIKAGERPRAVSFPCVVKPCSCGSSVGVSIVNDANELEAALACAEAYEGKILIEDKIEGREFSVGVLNGKTLPAIEICPARLNTEEAARLSEAALKAHRALGLGSYSRIDFIKDEKTGKFMCLEANTLPGMTPTSLLPQEAAAAGIGYDELCEMIALTAIKK